MLLISVLCFLRCLVFRRDRVKFLSAGLLINIDTNSCSVWSLVCFLFIWCFVKDAHSGLRQFLPAEIPLQMIKDAFYFTSKAHFVLKIFKFLSWLFGHVAKRLYKRDKVNFKYYDFTAWLTNNCNAHIAQYLEE